MSPLGPSRARHRARAVARSLAVAAVALTVLAPAASAAVPRGFWGVNATGLLGRADAATHFASIKSLGIDWVRVDAHWHVAEPYAPVDGVRSYRWGTLDHIVGNAVAQGLSVRPMAGYSPAWASADGSKFGAPRDPRDYAAFVEALLLRYGPYGEFWQTGAANPGKCKRTCLVRGERPITHVEVWNEPNTSYFWHGPDPERYAALLEATIDRVRAHAPLADVQIVAGGLLIAPASAYVIPVGEFTARMTAARPSLTTTLGEVAVHAYNNDTWVIQSQLQDTRARLDAAGLSAVPMLLNENGWTTSAQSGFFLTPISEDLRAQKFQAMIGRLNLHREALRLSGYAPYTWLTRELDPANGEHWFGIGNHDGTPKPSARALAESFAMVGTT